MSGNSLRNPHNKLHKAYYSTSLCMAVSAVTTMTVVHCQEALVNIYSDKHIGLCILSMYRCVRCFLNQARAIRRLARLVS